MEVRKTYHSGLTKETLFRAWISPEMTIDPVTKIECNPVIGGDLKLYSKSEYGEGIMAGQFALLEFAKELTYSWHWEGSEETTEVNVQFLESDRGAEVHVTHSGFISEESRKMHDEGWDHYFKSLEEKIRLKDFQ